MIAEVTKNKLTKYEEKCFAAYIRKENSCYWFKPLLNAIKENRVYLDYSDPEVRLHVNEMAGLASSIVLQNVYTRREQKLPLSKNALRIIKDFEEKQVLSLGFSALGN